MKQLKSPHTYPKNSSILQSLPASQSKLLIPLLIGQICILTLAAGGIFGLKYTQSPPIQAQERENSRNSPEKAVGTYFSLINDGIRQRNLQSAWQSMSANFQYEDAGGDYGKFDLWWQKLQQVEVQQITQTILNTSVPQVEAKVLYHFKDGRICPDYVRFSLIWDAQNKVWLLDSRDRLLPGGKFIC